MNTRKILGGLTVALGALLAGVTPASAGSHLWRFNEIYSNADGTIQFIEMKECCGSVAEWGLGDKWVLAVNTGNQYTFPENVSGDTAFQHLLLATEGFAALPGVPKPDYIIPDAFIPFDGDTFEYWLYKFATWTYAKGELPLDGLMSLNEDHTTGVNSPTNFAGETGSVELPSDCEGDANGDGLVDPLDSGFVLARFGCPVGTGDSGCDAADQNGDGLVDPLDSGFVLARFGCAVGTGDEGCDTADQNGDGFVDPLDVGFILARFGTCD